MSRQEEAKFVQEKLKPELERRFPSCYILKQTGKFGIPDLLVLCDDKWAALETKKAKKAERQPNQEHHVAAMNEMSYAAFVHPDNYLEVLDDLQQTFGR